MPAFFTLFWSIVCFAIAVVVGYDYYHIVRTSPQASVENLGWELAIHLLAFAVLATGGVFLWRHSYKTARDEFLLWRKYHRYRTPSSRE